MKRMYSIASIAILLGLFSSWTGSNDLAPSTAAAYLPHEKTSYEAESNLQMACMDMINVIVDEDCQFLIEPKSLLLGSMDDCVQAGDFKIFIEDRDPSNKEILDGCGKFRYVIQLADHITCTSFDPCWGYINAEDKIAPQIKVPENKSFLLSCLRIDTVFNLLESLEFTDTAYVADNCSGNQFRPLYDFYDEIITQETCENILIHRNFFAEDEKGNRTIATQKIELRRPDLSIIEIAPSFDLDNPCYETQPYPIDELGNLHPSVSGYPFFIDEFGDTTFIDIGICGLTAAYEDTRFEVCGNLYKLERIWAVKDWCGDRQKIFKQLIKVGDVSPPVIDLKEDSIGFSTGPFDCKGVIQVPMPEIEDACSSTSFFAELYQITQDWYQTKPDTSFVQSLNVTAQGRFFQSSPIGSYMVVLEARDLCKNSTKDTIEATIVDRTAPVAKCIDQLNVTLDGNGFARIKVSDIDEGSFDNCQLDSLEIRRYEIYEGINDCALLDSTYYSVWGEFVYLSCCDLNQGPLKIELRAMDRDTNVNICWTDIIIEDKLGPTCIAPKDSTTFCDTLPIGFDYRNFEHLELSFGLATGRDACGPVTVEELPIDDEEMESCDFGTFYRFFIVRDAFGNESPICEQRITILPRHNYEIRFPKDTFAICAIPYSQPVITNELYCDLLAVSRLDEQLSAAGEECYKIFRKFQVINWCEYDGQSDPYIIDRDVDCNGIPGDKDIWVLVRPDTTVYLDANNNELDSIPEMGERTENCQNIETNPYGFWYNTDSVPTLVSNGFWEYTQIIKVFDTIAPTIFVEDSIYFCLNLTESCAADAVVSFNIVDECVAGNISIETYFEGIDNTYERLEDDPWDLVGRYPKYLMSGVIPEGKYRVEIIADDQCGNVTRVAYFLEIVDCDPPGLICNDGLVVELMPLEPGTDFDGDGDTDLGGNIVNVQDFLPSELPDDCSGPVTYSINRVGENPDRSQETLVITCDDPEDLRVEVYAWDNADNPFMIQADGSNGGPNYDFCSTFILVQDNDNSFCDNPTNVEISGAIATLNGGAIANVALSLSGNGAQRRINQDNGEYLFNRLEAGYDYTVSPEKTDGGLKGVSTLDIIYISKHILGIRPFTSPYQWIAADLNRSGSVSTLDLIVLRRAILNLDQEAIQLAGWRFLDARHEFTTSGNPLTKPIPEVINLNNLDERVANIDFIGIKMGDLSGLLANRAASSQMLQLELEDQYLPANQITTISVRAKDLAQFDGLQFALFLDPDKIDVLEYHSGILSESNGGLVPQTPGLLKFSWDAWSQEAADSDELFTLLIRPKKELLLSEFIHLSDRYLQGEAYQNEQIGEVNLTWKASALGTDGLVVGKVFPNPGNRQFSIPFHLKVSETVQYSIQNIQGQVLQSGSWTLDQGAQIGKFELNDQQASGVYLLRIRAGGISFTQKLIKY